MTQRSSQPSHAANADAPVPALRSASKKGAALLSPQAGAIVLIFPILCMIAVLFVYPVATMLFEAVDNAELADTFAETRQAFGTTGSALDEGSSVYRSLAADLMRAKESGTLAGVATRLNFRKAGFRSLLMKTAAELDAGADISAATFTAIDTRWADPAFLDVLRSETGRFTTDNILAALDMERGSGGSIQRVGESRRIYVDYLTRTLWVSTIVTALALLIAYPMAFVMAHARGRTLSILIILVLVPFWTSLLVRAAAWMVLLQKEGIVNAFLVKIGLLDQPIQLIFNRFGVIVAVTYTLIPFAVLPLYSSMKGIAKSQMLAAASLGARPVAAFRTVYLPQSMPGIVAAMLLCFMLANGFYITPALVGGPGDQLLSSLIADFAIGRANWGMASAIAIVLGLSILIVLVVFGRFLKLRSIQ